MLLAAGRGERMRPLTDHTPKPLLQAGGKPLIVWHIENLVRAGITELVINHAHLGAQIEQALGDGSQFGASIRYSDEGTALETAGGIAYALHLLCSPSPLPPLPQVGEGNLLPSPARGRGIEGEGEGEVFAVVNGDIWCDYDFSRLPQQAAALKASGDAAHLVLVNNPPQHPDGDFGLIDGRLKPTPLAPLVREEPNRTSTDKGRLGGVPVLTFSGIGLYQPSLFSNIVRGTKAPLAPLLREQIALGKVSGEHHTGRWTDVGTPQRLAELDNMLNAKHNAKPE
jgi:MurNAc alpha-1-phosphate uridylyltransferase